MSSNVSIITAITSVVVALIGGGGLAGIAYGRRTVIAQADSINVATAQNVVRLVNAQLESSEKEHRHERDAWELQMKREREDCQRQIESCQAQVAGLQKQIEKILRA